MPIVNNSINAVAMTVLPDAPFDVATGLQVPTIAVATDGGISVIKHDGTVATDDRVWSNGYDGMTFKGDYLYYSLANQGAGIRRVNVKSLTTPVFRGDLLNIRTDNYANMFSAYSLKASSKVLAAGNCGGAPSGLHLLLEHTHSPALGLTCHIATAYSTGYMASDIRRAYLCNTEVETASAELLTNGNFADGAAGWSGVNADGWSITDKVVGVNAVNGTGPYRTCLVKAGKTYQVTFTISNYTSGIVYPTLFNGNNGPIYTSNGTFTCLIQHSPDTSLGMFGFASSISPFSGALDNISVKEAIPDRSYRAAAAAIYGTLVKSPVA